MREYKNAGDSGYQGILKLHKNSETPKKKPKDGELTYGEKAENRRICVNASSLNISAPR
jgi:hypothetical protein